MMTAFKIIQVSKDDELLQREVLVLFDLMYQEMLTTGLMLPLPEDGPDLWLKAVRPTLGRFGVILAAMEDDKMAGFAHGALRSTPEFLGNLKIGSITHVYVRSEFRRSGVAIKLVKSLEEWFSEHGVHSVELQVLDQNPGGISFWEKLGYGPELRQYRKILS